MSVEISLTPLCKNSFIAFTYMKLFIAEMTILSWDQNFLKSLDILTSAEEHDSVKIWTQNATTGLSFVSVFLNLECLSRSVSQ